MFLALASSVGIGDHMQGPVPLLNVMTMPPGATKTQARMVFDGIRGAIFLYSNGGPTGALVGSWAISAGTDPYGNPYPQGFNVAVGALSAGDLVINAAGEFLYSAAPAAGNLIYSNTNTTGTDPFGNNYLAGLSNYNNSTHTAINITSGGLRFYTFTPNPGAVFTLFTAGVQISQGVLTAGDQIINNAGQFIYSATPAAGNLIYSNANVAGTDAFGNTYLAGDTRYNNTTRVAFNITITGYSIYSFTAQPGATFTQTGAVVLNSAGMFQYSGAPAAGNLIYSEVPNMFAGGTDPFGNVYLPGLTLYNNTLSPVLAVNQSNEGIYFYYSIAANPGATWLTGANFTVAPSAAPRGVQLQIDNTPNDFFLANVTNLGGNAINVAASGKLTNTPQVDLNVYTSGHLIQQVNSTLINSTSFTTLTTLNLGVGNYRVTGTAIYQGHQAAGLPGFQLSSTATLTVANLKFRFVTPGSPTTDDTGFTSVNTTMLGPTLLNASTQWFEFELLLNVTGSGTLSFIAACSIAADTYTIQRAWIETEQY